MLLIATVVWGFSFALQKHAGEALNASMAASHSDATYSPASDSAAGPMLAVGFRFILGALLWGAIFRASRSGWSAASLRRGMILGVMLVIPMALQTLLLDLTDEATAAVFTSLAVLFTPLILRLGYQRPIPGIVWVAAVAACIGVWVMNGASNFVLGAGEIMGLLCAVMFAWHLIVLNVLVRRDSEAIGDGQGPYRMTLAQFAVVGIVSLSGGIFLMIKQGTVPQLDVVLGRSVLGNIVLLVLFPTIVSFGLVNVFQPRVRPERAALIYLLEPLFAGGFAYLYRGQGVTGLMLVGGAMVLLANALVEFRPVRRKVESDH